MCLAHPTWHWKCGLLNQKHFWPNILFVPNQDQSKINKPLSSQYITNNLHIAHSRWHWKLYLHNQNIFWPNTVHSLDLRRTKLSMALTPKKIIFCQDWPQQKTIHFNLAYQIPTIDFQHLNQPIFSSILILTQQPLKFLKARVIQHVLLPATWKTK